MLRLIGPSLPFLLLCGGVLVMFLFFSLLAVMFLRMRDFTIKGKALYLWTLLLELPGVAARFLVFTLLAPFLLMPVWVGMYLIFVLISIITVIGYWLSGETPTVDTFTALAGAGSVLLIFAAVLTFLVAFWAAWGPIITSILSLLGILGGGQRYHRFSKADVFFCA